jgi:hypothetical protein
MNFYTFDLETAAIPKPGQPLNPADGLGISCAAACNAATGDVLFWWGGGKALLSYYADLNPLEQGGAIARMLERCSTPNPRMTAHEVYQMIRDLMRLADVPPIGWTMNNPIVTWNGLAFDWHVLSVESGIPAGGGVPYLAMQHVDLMFAFLSAKGYRLSLKSAAEGVGSRKGVEGASDGADAPALWQAGDYATALQYVAQDVIALRDVTAAVIRRGGFTWTAKSGRVNYVSFPVPDLEALRVCEVVQWPEPDQSWQSEPVNRHDSYRWMPIQRVPTPSATPA